MIQKLDSSNFILRHRKATIFRGGVAMRGQHDRDKTLTGWGMMLLAAAGLMLCLAGIVGVWVAKGHVDAIGEKLFEAADDSLAFMDKKLDRVETAFGNVHRRIGKLSTAVDRFPQNQSEAETESKSLLKTLDEEVFEQLKSAQTWLDSAHAVAVGVGKVSEAVVSSEYAASHEDSVGVAIAERLQDVSESTVEMLTTLKDARQGIVDLRDNCFQPAGSPCRLWLASPKPRAEWRTSANGPRDSMPGWWR